LDSFPIKSKPPSVGKEARSSEGPRRSAPRTHGPEAGSFAFGPSSSLSNAKEPASGPWVLGADLRGPSLDRASFPTEGGLLLIGNESKGLCPEAKALCRYLWGIPSFGQAESLNAAVAAAVCCHSIRLQG
ncbi:MAG: TrmH family RNA methyltransferase, partial [Bacteroidota bacterium]